MNAAKPAFTWADVTQQPEFQNASQQEREQLQLRYFQQVVAPSLPEEQYRDMRLAFFEATMPDVEVKRPGLLRRGWDAVSGQGEHARPEHDGEPASRVTGALGTAPGDMTRQVQPEPTEGPRWEDVAGSEAFQQADTRARHDMRQQFFRDNIAPGLEGEERQQAERDFYRQTDVRGTIEGSGWQPSHQRGGLNTWESGSTGRRPTESLGEARDRAAEIGQPREDGALPLSEELFRGLQNAGRGVMESYYGTQAMLSGDEEERQRLLQKAAELRGASEQNQATMPNFTDIRSPGDAARWAIHGIGAMAPSVSSIMAGGAAGGKAGALTGSLAGPKGTVLGAVAGSVMGSFSAGYMLYAGGLYSDIRQQGGEHEAARNAALKWGAPASAVSIVMPMAFLGSVSGYLGKDFVRGRARNMLLGAGIGGVGEGTAEAMAEAFTIMGEEEVLGRTMTDEERRTRIINAGAAGGLMGTSMGAVGGGVQQRGDIDTMIDGFIADMERAYSEGASEEVRQAVIGTLESAESLTDNQRAMLDFLRTERADRNRPLNQELKEVQEIALAVHQREDATNLERFTELSRKQADAQISGTEALELIAIQVNSPGVRDMLSREAQRQIEGDPAAQQQATQDIATWEQAWRDHEQQHGLEPIDLQRDTGISATVSPGSPMMGGQERAGQPGLAMSQGSPDQAAAAEDQQVAAMLRAPAEGNPALARAQESMATGNGFAFLWDRADGDAGATDALTRMQERYLAGDGEAAAAAYQEAVQTIRALERRGAQQQRKQAAIEGARQQAAAEGGDALTQTLAGEQAEAQANEISARENAADPITRPAPPTSPRAGEQMPMGPGSAEGQAQQPTTQGLTPGRVPVERIQVDPEAYQFRTEVNEAGVDSRLEGVQQWDDLRAGNLVLHERADGSVFAADGHHRIDLARRLQQPDVNAIVLREADGFSVEDARRLAAEANIAAGNATAIDAAKVFRDSQGATEDVIAERNLPRRSQIVRDGANIARLDGEAFGAVLNGVVSEKDGAAIGRAFEDPAQQLAAIDVFRRVQPQNDNQRALLVNEIRQAGFAESQGEQGGLFGDDPAQSLIGERVRVMDRLRQDLMRDRRLFATLNRNARTAEQAGNVIATETNEALSDNAARAVALLERVTTNPEMNAQVNEAALRVSEGQRVGQAVTELKEALLRGTRPAAAQPDRASTPRSGQAEAAGQEQRGDQRVSPQDDARAADAGQQRLDGAEAGRLTYRSNGQPFATPHSAMASGVARRAQARGQTAEAVPVEGGFAVRVQDVAQDAADTAATEQDTAQPLLETQTEESLAARERETQRAEQAETSLRRQEAERAQADRDADDFVLSGSDTTADQAMARGQDSLFSTRAQAAEGAPQASEIEALLANVPELADARVVQSHRDLPPQALMGMALRGINPTDVRGMYVGGELYVVANNLDSAEEGVRVAVHEAVGHKGVRGVLGDDLVPVMRQVYRTLPLDPRGREALNEVRRDYPFLDQNNADHQVTIAEEMIAHLAEKGWNPGPVRRAIARIRELLRRYFPNMRWTDADVMALAERSREYLRRQQAAINAGDDALFSLSGDGRLRMNSPVHMSDGSRLSGFTDSSRATLYGYDANGEPFTVRSENVDAGTISSSQDSDRTANSLRRQLRRQQAEAGGAEALMSMAENLDGLTAQQVADQLREAHPGLTLDLMERGSRATLSRIVVPDNGRELGTGTQVMRHLARWADANGVTLALTPSSDFGGNTRRLRKFYRRFGFVDNQGRSRDFEISESMYREPGADARFSLQGREGEAVESSAIDGDAVGGVRLYHGTTPEAAAEIARDGVLRGPVYMTPRQDMAGEYSQGGPVIELSIREAEVKIDLDMPGGRLLSVEEANRHLDNDGWSLDDYIDNGHSVGVEQDVAVDAAQFGDDALFSLGDQASERPTADQVRESLQGIEGLGRPAVLDSADQLDLDTGLRLTLRGLDPQTVVAFHDDAGRLRVIAGNAESSQAAVNAAVVERVRQQGLKRVVGDRISTVTNRGYEQLAKETGRGNKAARQVLRAVRAEFTYLDPGLPADRAALALEVAARLNERGQAPDFVTTMLDEVRTLLGETHGVTDISDLGLANRAYLTRMQRDFGGKAPPEYHFGLDLSEAPGYGTLTDLATNLVDADGRPIDDMRVESVWTLNPARGAYRAFLMSQSDRLRESGNRVLVALGNRLDRARDAEERRNGMVRSLLRPAIQKMQEGGKKQKKQNLRDFEQYWRDWENGRKDKARDVYERNPAVAAMVDAAAELFHRTGIENQTVKTPNRTGVWVKDGRRYRRIGKVAKGQFWPRVMRAEVSEAIRNPNSDPALWDQLVSALVDADMAKDKQEAGTWLRDHQRDVYSPEGTNDFYAAMEKARGVQLPEVFYDYSIDVVMDYGHNWSRRISQIEHYGQKLRPGDKDAWEEAYALATDEKTKSYIGEVSQVVYGARNLGAVGKFMRNTNVLATGLHLTNFATASQNLVSGSGHNASIFGGRRMMRAYAELARDHKAVVERGIELGILGKDYLSLIRDAERGRMMGEGESGHTSAFARLMEKVAGKRISAEEGLREFTKWGMKWGGYNATEQTIRAGAMVAAEFQLADALDVWNKKPDSAAARKYRRIMRQNRLDVDALIRENGKGEETARYLRLMVNLPQGSYQADMVPLLFDTEYGKYFGKYGKFGTQASRTFWQQKMGPMLELFADPSATGKDRALAFADVLSYSGWALFSGYMNRWVRNTLFGMAFAGADLDEIWDRFTDGEFLLAASLLLNNLWNNAMSAGYLFGFFSSPLQATMDYRDRARVRNPMDPPAWAAIEEFANLTTKFAQQDFRLTGSDLLDSAMRTYGFPRVAERTAATAADLVGVEPTGARIFDFQIERLQAEMVRRDVSYIRVAAQRWADIEGIESRMGGSFSPGSTENTPANNRIHDAVRIGDTARARQLVLEELDGLAGKERASRIRSIRATLRARHPLRLGGNTMNQEQQAAFKRWAQQNLPPSRWETIDEVTRTYDQSMDGALWRIR